ncbi:polysaccharide biosynthesis/export family protein [Wenxinia saemankumensis]|uniref:Polysaccharide export outer membrane protein n=1 Tax=Wenxinia saemankumensis TaxID=1447782 RepID=A0A1M6HYV1_9RHOB|nr:polysaccharide biosynthesis/export family protein [Wenxinia saemankumensis]SHJ27410.1 polysaccharide export outer membrane protein [Wenxinia saemankumensis]
MHRPPIPRRRGPSGQLALSLLLAAMPGPGRAQDAAPLAVERGDVLSVSVLEAPELARETRVDAEGRIVLPEIGRVAVAGGTIDDARRSIEAALRAADIIRSPTVIVEVAAYRPFYVGGAVAEQGAVPYEVGLTVRHALLLAGGLDRGEGGGALSPTEFIEMNAEWRATTFALFEVDSRVARLQAELELRSDMAAPDAAEGGRDEARAIALLDAELLSDRLAIRSADQEHLRDLMAAVEFELDVLARQSANLDEAAALQREDLENARQLLTSGLTSQPRVRELEREQLQLTRGQLDVQAYTARARQNVETIGYELESADRTMQIGVRAALRDATLERARLAAELETMAARLVAAGIRLTDDARLSPLDPSVRIHRRVGGQEVTLEATMSTEILPGDILDVAIAVPPQG